MAGDAERGRARDSRPSRPLLPRQGSSCLPEVVTNCAHKTVMGAMALALGLVVLVALAAGITAAMGISWGSAGTTPTPDTPSP